MIKEDIQIINNNLSHAWAEAYLAAIQPGVDKIIQLTISVSGIGADGPYEDPGIREAIDRSLIDCKRYETHTTANTIFPISLWNKMNGPQDLFDKYMRILPALKRADRNNRYGLYFERLISYGEGQKNQLLYIINTYQKGNHRPSALQAAIYDPLHDQTDQRRRGFPCLHQIAFVTNPEAEELYVHGFYASQYLFDRAYGNILGLARLGLFMGSQMGLKLARVSSTAAVAEYGSVPKRDILELTEIVRGRLQNETQEDPG